MKILVLTSTYPRWAGDTEPGFVHELNKRLANAFEITTLAPHYPGAKLVDRMDNVEIIRFKYFFTNYQRLCYNGGILPNIKKSPFKALLIPFYFIMLGYQIRKLCRNSDFSLIHCHWIIPQGLTWTLTSKLFGIRKKAILTSHGADLFSLSSKLMMPLKKSAINSHHYLCVVSTAMKAKAIEMGVDENKIKVLPMGVDLYHTFTPSPNPLKRDGLIFVGRLVSKKGVNILLQAFARLKNYVPDEKLTIIGDGPTLDSLKAEARNLNIENSVYFLGSKHQIEVRDYLRRANIAIFPSVETNSGDQEGLGLTIIEALGCGCTVIASELPAILDIKSKTSRLITFEPENVQKLFEIIHSRIASSIEGDTNKTEDIFQIDQLNTYDWKNTGNAYKRLYLELTNHTEQPLP